MRKRAIAWPTILCAGPGCLLNTNEVRARAAEFARDWNDARYERGEAQSFYNEFFDVFGMKRSWGASSAISIPGVVGYLEQKHSVIRRLRPRENLSRICSDMRTRPAP